MSDKTRNRLANAMRKLMVRKPIEQIRVTELCREAEVERPTFYYHFRDKYDLIAWIFFRTAFETDVISLKSTAESLNRMRKDYIFYKRAFEYTAQNPLWEYMLEYYEERYQQEAKRLLGEEELDPHICFCIRFYCYGAIGITREWLVFENTTPAETIVEKLFRAMPSDLRMLFFNE